MESRLSSNTSEAAPSQQQAQNVAAQSSIAIESVEFTNATDDQGNDIGAPNNKQAIKIVVRNVGTSKDYTISSIF